MTLVLALDTSGSLTPADLAHAQALATDVLQALPPGSEVAVVSFDDESRLVLGATSDPDAVRHAVGGLRGSGRFTALHDAVYDSSRHLRDAAGERRAILLVTDGRDENSAVNLEDGLELAREAGIPVFCVGVGRVEERVLRRIAKLTGGTYSASGEVVAAALAERIHATPRARAPVPPDPRPVASAGRGAVTAPSGSTPSPHSSLFLAVVGVVLLAAAALVALLARRTRPLPSAAGPGPPRLAREAGMLAGTVVARVDTMGDEVERTMLIPDRPVLAVTRGVRRGEVFPLSAESALSIGRARANDVVLEDASVSSQHCRVRPERGRFVVHDLQSTNGTLVNGRPVEHQLLDEGDVIQVGETSLQFRRRG